MNKLIMTAALVLGMATSATAATFSIVGGVETDIPDGVEGLQSGTATNHILEELGLGTTNVGGFQELGGFQGSNIQLNIAGPLKIELIGWEAGNFNSFSIGDSLVGRGLNGVTSDFVAVGEPLDTIITGPLAADAPGSFFDFAFSSINLGSGNTASVSNGSNNSAGANFFASFGGVNATRTEGDALWLFFDDTAVSGDNHDDLVVRISAVPLPAGALLLLTGLGALGLRRRKS